jgi:hypothetical protein
MGRTSPRVEPTTETTQAEPTAPRPVSPEGRALDQWGLPMSGPARARALAEAGKPDPRDEPDAWVALPAASAAPDKQD